MVKLNSRQFSIKQKKFEVFFAEDEHIEIYEVSNPGSTGFIFDDQKAFNVFINSITDISEAKIAEDN